MLKSPDILIDPAIGRDWCLRHHAGWWRRGWIRIFVAVVMVAGLMCAQTQTVLADVLNGPPAPALKRGVGYHAPMTWGATSPGGASYQWPPYQAHKYDINIRFLTEIKAKGFDHVRLSIDPGPFLDANPTQRAALDAHLMGKIGVIMQAGLDVVADLHPIGMIPEYSCGNVLSDGFFARYLDLAKSVARLLTRFDGKRVAFEPINEPCLSPDRAGDLKWTGMMRQLHDAIREVAPNMLLVIAGNREGHFSGLARIEVGNYRNSNVVFPVHYYSPFLFTHQGVRVDTTNPNPRSFTYGMRYPARPVDEIAFRRLFEQRVDSAGLAEPVRAKVKRDGLGSLSTYFSTSGKRSQVAQDFDWIRNWADSNRIHRSRVYVGEFGVVGPSKRTCLKGTPVREDRLAWVRDVRDELENSGFAWSYWALSENCTGMQLARANDPDFLDGEMIKILMLRR